MSAVDLYAVLGVSRDASRDEIREAWARAVAGLDPTAATFRVFTQAGEVLLDDERRAAYDADLAASEVAAAQTAEPVGAPETPEAFEPVDAPETVEPAAPAAPVPAPVDAAARTGQAVPTWVLAALLVLVLLVGGAAAFAAGPIGRALPDRSAPAGATDLADAVTAAEKAVVPVLSYDYRDLAGTKKAAIAYLTPKFREKYEQTFTLIEDNAPSTKAVVGVQVVGSAVAKVDGDEVEVLLFVNRPTTNKARPTPVVYKDQVTLTMVREGSSWRIDDMRTTPPA